MFSLPCLVSMFSLLWMDSMSPGQCAVQSRAVFCLVCLSLSLFNGSLAAIVIHGMLITSPADALLTDPVSVLDWLGLAWPLTLG